MHINLIKLLGRCLPLQSRYKDICIALINDAEVDIKSARILLENDIFSKSIFHSQQAVEKMIKSVLALNAIIITDEHHVSDKLALLFSKFNQLNEVIHEAKVLERQGSKPRYPLFHDPIKPIWEPSKEYKKSDAEIAINTANKVYNTLLSFIEKKYGVNK